MKSTYPRRSAHMVEPNNFFPEAKVDENGVMLNWSDVFQLECSLGRGRYANRSGKSKILRVVRKASCPNSNFYETRQLFAIKIPNEGGDDGKTEAEKLSKTEGLDSVVKFYGRYFFPPSRFAPGEPGEAFLVLEYLPGENDGLPAKTLAEVMSYEEHLPDFAFEALRWVLRVIVDLENRGVVHEDLHEGNIMVSPRYSLQKAAGWDWSPKFVLFDFDVVTRSEDDTEDVALVTLLGLAERLCPVPKNKEIESLIRAEVESGRSISGTFAQKILDMLS